VVLDFGAQISRQFLGVEQRRRRGLFRLGFGVRRMGHAQQTLNELEVVGTQRGVRLGVDGAETGQQFGEEEGVGLFEGTHGVQTGVHRFAHARRAVQQTGQQHLVPVAHTVFEDQSRQQLILEDGRQIHGVNGVRHQMGVQQTLRIRLGAAHKHTQAYPSDQSTKEEEASGSVILRRVFARLLLLFRAVVVEHRLQQTKEETDRLLVIQKRVRLLCEAQYKRRLSVERTESERRNGDRE
jgi:hypothetical protein